MSTTVEVCANKGRMYRVTFATGGEVSVVRVRVEGGRNAIHPVWREIYAAGKIMSKAVKKAIDAAVAQDLANITKDLPPVTETITSRRG
jgi:phosphoribosylaminoimidazole carboxylase (NCAIR synthetase)